MNTNRLYILIIILLPIIFSNLSMSNSLPGYSYFRFFFFVPKSIKFLEVLLVGLFYIRSKYISHSYNFLDIVILVFSVIFIIGNSINNVSLLQSIQGLYSYIYPWLIISTISTITFTSSDFFFAEKLYKIILIVCVPLCLVGFLYFRFLPDVNPGDVTNLLFRNSHVSAIYMFILFFYGIAQNKITKKRSYLIFGVLAFLMALLGFNEKATLFVFLLIPIYLVLNKQISLKKVWQYGVVGMLIIGSISYYFIETNQNLGILRIDLLKEVQWSEIGPIKSYVRLPSIFAEESISTIFGSGYGTLGSPIVQTKIAAGNTPYLTNIYNSSLVYAVTGQNTSFIQSALDWTANIITSLIVENGVLCFLLFLVGYGFMMISWKNSRFAPSSIASILLVLAIASVSNVNSLEEVCLLVPICIFSSISKVNHG